MKLKAVVTSDMPNAVAGVLSSKKFALAFLDQVVGEVLGVEEPRERPAEFYVQKPDFTVNCGGFGVELRLTGVSREGRKAKQFHDALTKLHELAKDALQKAMAKAEMQEQVQLFCVIMLTADVETAPGSGTYSNVLEHEAEWVKAASEDASSD